MSESPAEKHAVPDHRLTVRAVLRTDVGKVRAENQDFATLTIPEQERSGRLMIVADGMGGHRGGATASRLAAETVKEQFLAADSSDVEEVLRAALVRANARIWSEAQRNPDLRGMGTTTSALVIRDSKGWLAHVGDSRIYLVRGDDIRQLTDDHSLVASMVREGLLTALEAETHPRRNVLQRSMGVSEEVEVDVRGPLDLQEGDTFIICSDGLHGVVKEDELKQVARLPLEEAADEFVRRALAKGAPDNVTVIVARIERDGEVAIDTTVRESRDAVLFDDTIREPAPPMSEPHAAPAEQPAAEPVSEPTASQASGGGAAPAAAGKTRPLSLFKWTLIFVLVLGAAGAGLFWTQQQRFATRAASSSR